MPAKNILLLILSYLMIFDASFSSLIHIFIWIFTYSDGAQIILKPQNFHCVPNECARLINTVGIRIIQNTLYQNIFIFSRPFHKNRSTLESWSCGGCEGQTDVLLSATQVYGLQMDLEWKKNRTYSPAWALWQEEGEGLLLPGWEWAVCLFFGDSQPEEVSLESWWVGLGSPGQSLCQAEARRRAGCKGRGPGVRWWREMFKHFFPCKLFRVARVVWSQRVISGVNCLHRQGNQFSVILQTAVFSELFLLAAIYSRKNCLNSIVGTKTITDLQMKPRGARSPSSHSFAHFNNPYTAHHPTPAVSHPCGWEVYVNLVLERSCVLGHRGFWIFFKQRRILNLSQRTCWPLQGKGIMAYCNTVWKTTPALLHFYIPLLMKFFSKSC